MCIGTDVCFEIVHFVWEAVADVQAEVLYGGRIVFVAVREWEEEHTHTNYPRQAANQLTLCLIRDVYWGWRGGGDGRGVRCVLNGYSDC